MVTILLYAFIVVILLQAIYYLGIFSSFAFSAKPTQRKQAEHAVSVIICAKNEAENLKKNIPSILNQNYSNFEIVLINDASHDETEEIMEAFASKDNRIKVVNVQNNEAFWGKKKYALMLGIKAAKNNILLFTDADCQPATTEWISSMTAHFANQKTIVLGYGGYQRVKFSLLNALIRFETALTAIQYFSYAKIGMPYMGVGRNLAYHQQEFYKTNGFVKHIHIRSGDDDLFVNEAATAKNTTTCFSEDSFTYSEAKKTFKSWFNQKRRHVSTAKHYKPKHKFWLGLYYVSQVLFFGLSVLLLSLQSFTIVTLALIAFRYLMCYFVIGFSVKKLKEPHLTWFFPFFELFLVCFQFLIFIANSISKPIDWK